MKKLFIPVFFLITSILFFSCAQQTGEVDQVMLADSAVAPSSSDELVLDSSRVYKQTAYVKMRVKDVQESKKNIFQIVKSQHGLILSSVLNNQIEDSKTVALSKDSANEYRKVDVSNSFSLKIPVQQLDTTLQLLEAQGIYVDESTLDAEDITAYAVRSKEDKDLNEETLQELKKTKRNISRIQMQYDIKKGENDILNYTRNMQYVVRYCDLKLDIYQTPVIQVLPITNVEHFRSVREPFGYAFSEALGGGVELFRSLLLGLTHLWLVMLFGILIVVGWKMVRRKRQKATA